MGLEIAVNAAGAAFGRVSSYSFTHTIRNELIAATIQWIKLNKPHTFYELEQIQENDPDDSTASDELADADGLCHAAREAVDGLVQWMGQTSVRHMTACPTNARTSSKSWISRACTGGHFTATVTALGPSESATTSTSG